MVRHYLETKHNFNFKDYKMLVYIHNRRLLNLVPCLTKTLFNKDLAFLSYSLFLVRLVLKSYKILYFI